MFRYLEKYVGTYRVLTEFDPITNDFPRDKKGKIEESYDELYIPCSKGIIKHTYEPYYLCWMTDKITTGRNVAKELKDKGVEIYRYDEVGTDVLIWFDETYIKRVASVVKPKTAGKGIPPFSKRNLEKDKKLDYKIPEEDIIAYQAITEGMALGDKLKFSKAVIKDFDDEIIKIKGKSYDLKKERDNSGLPNKEFIHFIGLWNEFLQFTKGQYKLYKGGK